MTTTPWIIPVIISETKKSSGINTIPGTVRVTSIDGSLRYFNMPDIHVFTDGKAIRKKLPKSLTFELIFSDLYKK